MKKYRALVNFERREPPYEKVPVGSVFDAEIDFSTEKKLIDRGMIELVEDYTIKQQVSVKPTDVVLKDSKNPLGFFRTEIEEMEDNG